MIKYLMNQFFNILKSLKATDDIIDVMTTPDAAIWRCSARYKCSKEVL